MNVKPHCPLCGAPMKPRSGGYIHGDHPKTPGFTDRFCFLQGSYISARHVHLWNTLPNVNDDPSAWFYTVVDGYPRFNDVGQGVPVTLDFLNACFDYLRRVNDDATTDNATAEGNNGAGP